MRFVQKLCAVTTSAALASFSVFGLSGCGEAVAATVNGEEILEADITEDIENWRTNLGQYAAYYGYTDADEFWEEFVYTRMWDTEGDYSTDDTSESDDTSTDDTSTDDTSADDTSTDDTSNDEDTVTIEVTEEELEESGGEIDLSEEDDSTDSTEESADETTEGETTEEDEAADHKQAVADLRDYVIRQEARDMVAEQDVEAKGITVTDEEVEEYISDYKEEVESTYGTGTFESYLQVYAGYEDLEEYESEAADNLKLEKLQEQQAPLSEDESSDDSSDDSDDSTDDTTTSTETYDTEAWETYVDGLVEAADIQINDAPSDLSYDPEVIAASADSDESTDDTTDDSTTTDDTSTDDTTTDDSTTTDDTTSDEGATDETTEN